MLKNVNKIFVLKTFLFRTKNFNFKNRRNFVDFINYAVIHIAAVHKVLQWINPCSTHRWQMPIAASQTRERRNLETLASRFFHRQEKSKLNFLLFRIVTLLKRINNRAFTSHNFSVSLSGRSNASTMQIIARSENNLCEAYGNGERN